MSVRLVRTIRQAPQQSDLRNPAVLWTPLASQLLAAHRVLIVHTRLAHVKRKSEELENPFGSVSVDQLLTGFS